MCLGLGITRPVTRRLLHCGFASIPQPRILAGVITLRENYELLDDFYCRFALILAHIHSRLNVALSIYSAMSDYSKLRGYHTTYTTVNYIFIPLLILLSICNSNDRINELLCRAEYHYNTLGADAAIATVREIDDKHEYVIDSNVARFLILWVQKSKGLKTLITLTSY